MERRKAWTRGKMTSTTRERARKLHRGAHSQCVSKDATHAPPDVQQIKKVLELSREDQRNNNNQKG